jgi:branched-chain amino acid transport system ATP-binding protein
LLSVRNLDSGYGNKQVLNGVSVEVGAGEVVALIGHNGAGKSTVLKCVFGTLPIWGGEVLVRGHTSGLADPRSSLHRGLAYVPQGARVFGKLTVRENLLVSLAAIPEGTGHDPSLKHDHSLERVQEMFPILKRRSGQWAATLSGGERQMLALGCAMLHSPRLLLLDEPTLGLSPVSARESLRNLESLSRQVGVALLIVEQRVREVLRIARRVYALRNGSVTFHGDTAELRDDEKKLKAVYL